MRGLYRLKKLLTCLQTFADGSQKDLHSETGHREPKRTVFVSEHGQIDSPELVVDGHVDRVQFLVVLAEDRVVGVNDEVAAWGYLRPTLEIEESLHFLVQGKQNAVLASFFRMHFEK